MNTVTAQIQLLYKRIILKSAKVSGSHGGHVVCSGRQERILQRNLSEQTKEHHIPEECPR